MTHRRHKLKRIGTRYLRFFLCSLVGTAVEMGVLWLCSELIFSRYVGTYIVSPIIAFECGMFTDYMFYYHFVWHDRIHDHSLRSFLQRGLAFNLSCVGTLLCKLGVLLLVERLSGWSVLACNLLAICFSGIMNFVLSELAVFRGHKQRGH
ncbi:MAG: GtrA family protein [Bacteroidales bacterium]|nr:GtrA family protein [Bacteroidales bacterium]